MKKLGIVFAGLVALSTLPASAADLAVKAAPVAVGPAWSWTGFYIGINSGFVRSQGSLRSDTVGPVFLETEMYGPLVGGTVGYNWQVGSWVVGVEGDWAWSDVNGAIRPPVGPPIMYHYNVDNIATLRGRLGYAVRNLMFYVTGGAAWADLQFTRENQATLATNSETHGRWGYTVGMGFEWAPFGPNWSTKFEWLYYDLGRGPQYASAGTVLNGLVGDSFHIRHDGHIFRTGINYHFNFGGPVRASY